MRKLTFAAIILGLCLTGLAQDRRPQRPARPKLPAAVKIPVDPDALTSTSPKTFEITDPQLGTRCRSRAMGLCRLSDGRFVMAYEGVVDEIQGGHTAGLLALTSSALRPTGRVMQFTTKHPNSFLMTIFLTPFANDRILLSYCEQADQSSDRSVSSMLLDKSGRMLKSPVQLHGYAPSVRLDAVTLMSGGRAAMVFFGKDETTWIRVIGSDGKIIVKRRPLTNCPITPTKTCAVPEIARTVRLEEDGTPLLGVTCDGVGGLAKIDAYGQWIGRFREFRMRGGEDLKENIQGFARLPGDTRYLLHLKGQPDSLVVMNEPRPGHGVHQFGNVNPVARERSQIFSWSTGTALVLDRKDVGQNRYDMYARVLDKVSTPVKKEKVVLPACIPPVAAVRVNVGLLIVSSTAMGKVFQYTLITR